MTVNTNGDNVRPGFPTIGAHTVLQYVNDKLCALRQAVESRLVDDWHKVVLHSWSVRCTAAAMFVELVPDWLPMFADWIPSWAFMSILLAGLAGRIIRQKKVSGERTA